MLLMTTGAGAAMAGVLGLVLGSFLNVVAYRLPRRESLVTPASRCPGCDTPIKPYDNVPGALVAAAPRPLPELRHDDRVALPAHRARDGRADGPCRGRPRRVRGGAAGPCPRRAARPDRGHRPRLQDHPEPADHRRRRRGARSSSSPPTPARCPSTCSPATIAGGALFAVGVDPARRHGHGRRQAHVRARPLPRPRGRLRAARRLRHGQHRGRRHHGPHGRRGGPAIPRCRSALPRPRRRRPPCSPASPCSTGTSGTL